LAVRDIDDGAPRARPGTALAVLSGLSERRYCVKNPALGECVAATPAIADDTLNVRTDGHPYAFAERP
jgi:hypothetical protein